MGAIHLAALVLALQTPSPDTTSPYSSPEVRHLIERAMARRRQGDSAVTDYRARIRYRLTVGVGRRRWAEVPTAAVEEQVADVQWQRPNDLRVDVVGRRFRSRGEWLELSSVWDRPWFVPRGVDDSVRIFSNDFPAHGALHPLAPSGPQWYRYALATSLAVGGGPGGTLRLLQIEPAVGFNPALEGTNWPETQRMVYNGLTDYGPTGELVPGLARSWTVSDSADMFTFRLTPGVTFHDGKECTAEDVRFTYESMADTKVASPLNVYVANLKAVETPDKHTVTLRFEVLASGKVGTVQVQSSAGRADMDRAAVEAVRTWLFEPARRGKEAVAVWVTLPVRFELNTR